MLNRCYHVIAFRHDDPTHDVRNQTDTWWNEHEYQPDEAHQRSIDAEITRDTRADAGDFLVAHRALEALCRRPGDCGFSRFAALVAVPMLRFEFDSTLRAVHNFSLHQTVSNGSQATMKRTLCCGS